MSDEFRVDQAPGTTEAGKPVIATNGNNNLIVVWADERFGHGDIFANILNPACQCPDDIVLPTGCISGHMTNKNTGAPLVEKTVILKRMSLRPRITKTVVTDSNGCYGFTDLVDGKYKISVQNCKGSGSKTKKITGGRKVNDVNFGCR